MEEEKLLDEIMENSKGAVFFCEVDFGFTRLISDVPFSLFFFSYEVLITSISAFHLSLLSLFSFLLNHVEA